MALANLIKPPQEADKAAEAAAQQAEIEKQRQEANLRAAEEKAATQARLEQLEKQVGKGFEQRQQQPQAPQSSEVHQAQQQLGITDEQLETLMAEGKGALALQAIAQQVSQNQLAEYNQQVTPVLGNLVKRGFKNEINDLRGDEHFDDLEEELRGYFDSNPQEMLVEGRVESKYYELIGKNRKMLQERAADRAERKRLDEQNAQEVAAMEKVSPTPTRQRAVEPPIRPASPTPTKPKEKVKLDPIRQELVDIYSGMGYNISPEEFVGIEEGKLLPKKMSADIQLGRSKPNVEY
jgi:hypothetical protein